MPKDLLNVVFAPKRFTETTDALDIISWDAARKLMHLYHSKPFLIGNPKSLKAPPTYPYPNSSSDNEALRDLICLWWGDITKCRMESIVNSANIQLKYGGGVCGAIHRRAGQQLYEQCIQRYPDGCSVTECALTDGFKLPARFVIHAVGPAKIDYVQLSATYKNALKLCIENGIKEICFCCIGCGTYQLPIKEASKVAVYSVIKFLNGVYIPTGSQSENAKNDQIADDTESHDKESINAIDSEQKDENNSVETAQNVEQSQKAEVTMRGVNEDANGLIENDDEIKEDLDEMNDDDDITDDLKSIRQKLARDYFTKIVFNCWTESELDAYKCWLTEQLG